MRSTIDRAGRAVIPKQIRQEAGISAGMPLEIRCREGRIEIEPVPLPLKVTHRGRLLVAVPVRPASTLRAATVERTRAALQRERGRGA